MTYASSIPFTDNCFDLVFSTNCITEHLDFDLKTFLAAISECIRAVKPSGQIHIFPFNDVYIPKKDPKEQKQYQVVYAIRRANQDRLLLLLRENPALDFDILGVPEASHKKLVIYKRQN